MPNVMEYAIQNNQVNTMVQVEPNQITNAIALSNVKSLLENVLLVIFSHDHSIYDII